LGANQLRRDDTVLGDQIMQHVYEIRDGLIRWRPMMDHTKLYGFAHRPSVYKQVEEIVAENLAPLPGKKETSAEIAHRLMRNLIEEGIVLSSSD
jgi:hypothetical protein